MSRPPTGARPLFMCQWFPSSSRRRVESSSFVDISNAFNSVHRTAVLQAVRTHSPSLAPWVVVATVPTVLLVRVFPALGVSNRGPLETCTFRPCDSPCHPRKACRVTDVSHPGCHRLLFLFFLDDGSCAGTAPAVRCFLPSLRASDVFLEVDLDKN